MSELFYTFEVAGRHVGYSKLVVQPNRLYSETRATFDDTVINNIFELRLKNGEVSWFKYNDNDWGMMFEYPVGAWPSSAYPLILAKAEPEYAYTMVNEASAETKNLVLTRSDDMITETQNGQTTRIFWLDEDGQVIKIDWGGAISVLVEDVTVATKGTVYAV